MGKFSKFCSKIFIATPIDVLCSNFTKFGQHEIGKVVRNLPNKKKFAWLSSSRYCADCAQNLPGQPQTMYSECSKFHPNRFTFGTVIFKHHQSVLQSESNIWLKPSFEPNKNMSWRVLSYQEHSVKSKHNETNAGTNRPSAVNDGPSWTLSLL